MIIWNTTLKTCWITLAVGFHIVLGGFLETALTHSRRLWQGSHRSSQPSWVSKCNFYCQDFCFLSWFNVTFDPNCCGCIFNDVQKYNHSKRQLLTFEIIFIQEKKKKNNINTLENLNNIHHWKYTILFYNNSWNALRYN